MTLFATKDFKTETQKFKAGDAVPDHVDIDKWAAFVSVTVDTAVKEVQPSKLTF
jgi:hypothetical protein